MRKAKRMNMLEDKGNQEPGGRHRYLHGEPMKAWERATVWELAKKVWERHQRLGNQE
jgi:hypothetical protein